MSERVPTGSRYLYDAFDVTSVRIEANERVAQERWTALEYRLGQIETALARMEKRIWVAVYGVAAFLLTEGVQLLVQAAMK